jgi:hypothetical protein
MYACGNPSSVWFIRVGPHAELAHPEWLPGRPDRGVDARRVGGLAVDLVGEAAGHPKPVDPDHGVADLRRAVPGEPDVAEILAGHPLQDVKRARPGDLEQELPPGQVLPHGVVAAGRRLERVLDVRRQPDGGELLVPR